MNVPVVDLSRRGRSLGPDFAADAGRIAASGTILLGPETAAFEDEFATWLGGRYAIAVSSGAAALQLALRAVGIGPGDEVIVPAFTAVPTAAAVCATGATPVFADVDPATAALDPVAAAAARTERTRAVVPVHLYGRPADVCALATALPGVAVVEDAAQAHGAIGDHARSAAVAYSFYPTKNLGGIGDGGAVVTGDPDLAACVRRLRAHGLSADPSNPYLHTEVAQNFRISELEAAWLRRVLTGLDSGNARRRAIAELYRAAAPRLAWHADHADHVHHLAVVRVAGRESFRSTLAEAGVSTAVHYSRALTQQPAYAAFVRSPAPGAEAWAAECVTVPCFPELADSEVEHVASVLAAVGERTPGSRR